MIKTLNVKISKSQPQWNVWLLFNVGMPILSTFKLLMYDHNIYGESEQMDER